MALGRDKDSTGEKKPRVVGSRLGELTRGVGGRKSAIPKGGIPTDGPKVGAPRDNRTSKVVRRAIVAASVLVVLLVAFMVAVSVLSRTSVFSIENVEAVASEHLSEEDIVRLAQVEDGSTLINVDTDVIAENLRRNPWVESVSFERGFPDTLTITVTEREVAYVVLIGTSEIGWYMGGDNVWIEPVQIEAGDNESLSDAALDLAVGMGAVLITDLPSSVSPQAGAVATDEEILNAQAFVEQFSSDFASQVVCYSAPSSDDISCILSSGVLVELGSPSSIDSKEAAIEDILASEEGQVTYINVRVPSSATYRSVESDLVSEGVGATDTSEQEEEEFTSEIAPYNSTIFPDASATDAATTTDGETGDAESTDATVTE